MSRLCGRGFRAGGLGGDGQYMGGSDQVRGKNERSRGLSICSCFTAEGGAIYDIQGQRRLPNFALFISVRKFLFLRQLSQKCISNVCSLQQHNVLLLDHVFEVIEKPSSSIT
jgi:hypothetical protein